MMWVWLAGPAVMKVFRLPLQRRGYYKGYKQSVNPTITNSVATAAFRFGHSLVQRSLPRCDKTGKRFPFSKSRDGGKCAWDFERSSVILKMYFKTLSLWR